MDSGTDWLSEILQNVQLEQFYVPIRDQLQITRLAHFDYVHADDLERIGISKPGVRRLLDAVRKKKLQLWNRKFWNKLFGTSSSVKEKTELAPRVASPTEKRTCIILEKDIVLSHQLGTGSFGVVKRGDWHTGGEVIPVAVKILKADAFSQPGIYDDFRREVEAMHTLSHPNLIKLHGVVFHPLMMVCELAPAGALLDFIRSMNGKLSLSYISKWATQVAAGMAHLEKNRCLHRDLACRNILVSNSEQVKIGDFGLLRALPDTDDCYVMSERRRVPFPWCAPESLRTRQFSHASDVWMFAVALWEMYTFGEEPWIGLNGSEILRLIMREGQRLAAPAACPPDVYMLMMQCWDLDPKERPTFAGILRYMETNKFEVATCVLSYRSHGRLSMEAGDSIILIDKRPELHWWKGQNQNSLEIGLFPSSLFQSGKNKSLVISKKPLSNVKASPSVVQSSPAPEVVLRKRRTIESTQPASTRAGNAAGKQFNYNKLVNDRATLSLDRQDRLDRLPRTARDKYSKSLNQVREDLLIDLDLPPSTRSPSRRAPDNNISILDAPIDVAEASQEADAQQSSESLPSYSSKPQVQQTYSNIYGAKSLENLASPTRSISRNDPFDTSQFWPLDPPGTRPARPNYDIQSSPKPSCDIRPASVTTNRPVYEKQPSRNNYETQPSSRSHYDLQPATRLSFDSQLDRTPSVSQPESQRYSTNYAASTSDSSQVYSRTVVNKNNSINNSPYGTVSASTYANASALSMERNDVPNVASSLAEMSLDDRISESLNLRKKSNESVYANSPSTSAGPSNVAADTRYNDIPIYSNFDINPAQQQFLLETKDYYTKYSTPTKTNSNNDYEKNIYVPKYEDEAEKLRNFSECVENSKNYSSMKYQNVDYGLSNYSNYSGNVASASRSEVAYDEVNDTASNIYSEIAEGSDRNVYASAHNVYTNACLYDEVCAEAPRPHRPAPCPPPLHK